MKMQVSPQIIEKKPEGSKDRLELIGYHPETDEAVIRNAENGTEFLAPAANVILIGAG